MKLKSFFAASAIALAAASTPVAHADAVGSFQGVTFTLHIVDSDTFTLTIDNLLNASGDWATVTHIMALQISDFGTGFTGGTITPAGTPLLGGLNASGCNGSGTGICFTLTPRVASDNNDVFTIDLTGPAVALAFDQINHPHVKVNFGLATGGKVGSLGSADINFGSSTSSSGIASSSSSSSSGNVPAPSTGSMALLGLGLLAGSFLIRRNSRNS
jgi:MYXO-CTERM domain-containing protein